MALSKTVSKVSVKYMQPKLNSITFNLKLTDGAVVLDEDFSVEYRDGDSVAAKIADVMERMQKAIDRYKAEAAIFSSAALDNAVTAISGGLSL